VKERKVNLYRLSRIWREYSEFKRPQIAPSTYLRDYSKFEKRLVILRKVSPRLNNAIAIRDWMMQHYSPETTRRTLAAFNACCRWAMESNLMMTNPFEGVQKHIRKARQSETSWAAFTLDERDAIIQEFEMSLPFYAPWVKFLFWTGCRPEEAAALRWQHIKGGNEILFAIAHPSDMAEPQRTKNHKITRFPCNPRLASLLADLRAPGASRDDLIFKSRVDTRFNYTNFQTRYWKPTVHELVNRGVVAFYLSQYHARHTFITEALNHLSVADVSYLCRVSTKVLYDHYAGRSRHVVIPEF
jgi:integrase